MDNLHDKVALVTGSSRGIGRAIALALAAEGADVAINFVQRTAEAESAELEIRKLGRRCVTIQADVSDAKDVERLVESTENALGPIDILVTMRESPVLNQSRKLPKKTGTKFHRQFEIVLPHDAGCSARHAGTKWGRIVNLSSVAAQVGGVVGPHYAASKAGMLGLTRFYAQKLAAEGITSNAIAPALIDTEMVRANLNARPDRFP